MVGIWVIVCIQETSHHFLQTFRPLRRFKTVFRDSSLYPKNLSLFCLLWLISACIERTGYINHLVRLFPLVRFLFAVGVCSRSATFVWSYIVIFSENQIILSKFLGDKKLPLSWVSIAVSTDLGRMAFWQAAKRLDLGIDNILRYILTLLGNVQCSIISTHVYLKSIQTAVLVRVDLNENLGMPIIPTILDALTLSALLWPFMNSLRCLWALFLLTTLCGPQYLRASCPIGLLCLSLAVGRESRRVAFAAGYSLSFDRP